METFEIILAMGGAVLLSSILDQILPRISPPLIQIALGVCLAFLFGSHADMTLDPELFLVLFIAPLLFNDARNANKVRLWQNKGRILSLAIGLVVAMVFIVGFAVNAIVPSIPLACAFMLGAALGPTDAVAVESLSRSCKLEPRQHAVLQGESLINDASGVVSFQFAVAAAVTGTFSLVNATIEFLISFIGGLALGLIIALLAYYIRQKANGYGLDSTTFHVLLDILLPFCTFIIAETVGVSGILAAVAAGFLTGILGDRVIGPNSARLGIVTSNVWQMFAFALNGFVFVLLGMQLPNVMEIDPSIGSWLLIGYVLAITLIITLIRFIWVVVMNIYSMLKSRKRKAKAAQGDQEPAAETGPDAPPSGARGFFKSTFITTIGGPKGAITLSVIMSMPIALADGAAFPQRDLIIFLASGTIICTLLLTNFILPILAPIPKEQSSEYPESDEKIAKIKIDILRRVIAELEAGRTPENEDATRSVIAAYSTRMRRIRSESDLDITDIVNLRSEILTLQWNRIVELYEKKEVDRMEAAECILRIARSQSMLHRGGYRRLILTGLKHPITMLRALIHNLVKIFRIFTGKPPAPESMELRKEIERIAIARLQKIIEESHSDEHRASPAKIRAARDQLLAHKNALRTLEKISKTPALISTGSARVREMQRSAYYIELDEISQFAQEEKISRSAAKHLRENVFMMLVELEGEL